MTRTISKSVNKFSDSFHDCLWYLELTVANMMHTLIIRWRPYRVEYTGSLLTSEVKRRRARLVLGWGTAQEDLRVVSAFTTARFGCISGQAVASMKPMYSETFKAA